MEELKIIELEKQVAALQGVTRQTESSHVALDETRRRVNLSPIYYDPQVLAINSRAKERAL